MSAQQLSISFDRPRTLARRNDPPSSLRAAENVVASGTVRNHEAIILDLLRQYPARTTKELASLGPLDRVQVARRMKKLEEKGKVRREEVGTSDCKWWAV